MVKLTVIILLLVISGSNAFQIAHPTRVPTTTPTPWTSSSNLSRVSSSIRGGSTELSQLPSSLSAISWSLVTQSILAAKPMGIISLWATALSVVLPLTLMRKGYSFSIGYGYSVMAMAALLMCTYDIPFKVMATPSLAQQPAILLLFATLLYGFRLGTFLLLRMITVPSKARQMKEYDEKSNGRKATAQRISKGDWIQRIVLSVNVSLFYACMVSPLLYVLQPSAQSQVNRFFIPQMGAILAWLGLSMETIADAQKFIVKRKHGSHLDLSNTTFVGPTRGLFRLCRHPNYLGELVFWAGLFIGGMTSYRTRVEAWVCSSLGFVGILFIMLNATKRLDKKQMETYGGQDKYDIWKQTVPYPLFPGIGIQSTQSS